MKKTIILACLMTCSIGIFGQAKKPVFMVFPSELYCVQHDCFYLLDTAEGTQKMPDYGKCVTEDQDMMTAINIFSQWLVDRGVEVKDLSHAIKVTYGKEAEEGAKLGKPLYHRIIESSESISPSICLSVSTIKFQLEEVFLSKLKLLKRNQGLS